MMDDTQQKIFQDLVLHMGQKMTASAFDVVGLAPLYMRPALAAAMVDLSFTAASTAIVSFYELDSDLTHKVSLRLAENSLKRYQGDHEGARRGLEALIIELHTMAIRKHAAEAKG